MYYYEWRPRSTVRSPLSDHATILMWEISFVQCGATGKGTSVLLRVSCCAWDRQRRRALIDGRTRTGPPVAKQRVCGDLSVLRGHVALDPHAARMHGMGAVSDCQSSATSVRSMLGRLISLLTARCLIGRHSCPSSGAPSIRLLKSSY